MGETGAILISFRFFLNLKARLTHQPWLCVNKFGGLEFARFQLKGEKTLSILQKIKYYLKRKSNLSAASLNIFFVNLISMTIELKITVVVAGVADGVHYLLLLQV